MPTTTLGGSPAPSATDERAGDRAGDEADDDPADEVHVDHGAIIPDGRAAARKARSASTSSRDVGVVGAWRRTRDDDDAAVGQARVERRAWRRAKVGRLAAAEDLQDGLADGAEPVEPAASPASTVSSRAMVGRPRPRSGQTGSAR